MKIAHIVCTFPPYRGGMGNSAHAFADTLAQRGHKVTVFTTGRKREKDADELFKVDRLISSFKYGNAAILPQIIWKTNGFDVIHLHYPFYGTAIFILLKKIFSRRMKLIVHYHMDTVAGGIKGLIFKLSAKLVLPGLVKRAHAVTCGSLDYIENSNIRNLYEKYKDKFVETKFGVDLEIFKPDNKGRANKKILFVGGLDKAHYFKGVDILLRAFKEVFRDFGCELTIVGDGDMRACYMHIAQELRVFDYCYFASGIPRADLPKFYNECYALVLPSVNKSEAFGLVLLEALASGKPVIASNLPGVRSVFENGKQGLLIEPNNYQDLAEKLKTLLGDAELAQKMGEEGRKLAEQEYSWDKVGERLEEAYK